MFVGVNKKIKKNINREFYVDKGLLKGLISIQFNYWGFWSKRGVDEPRGVDQISAPYCYVAYIAARKQGERRKQCMSRPSYRVWCLSDLKETDMV